MKTEMGFEQEKEDTNRSIGPHKRRVGSIRPHQQQHQHRVPSLFLLPSLNQINRLTQCHSSSSHPSSSPFHPIFSTHTHTISSIYRMSTNKNTNPSRKWQPKFDKRGPPVGWKRKRKGRNRSIISSHLSPLRN